MAQSFKNNQESLYYIDFRFLVDLVIIVFNKKKYYSLNVLKYLFHRFTALSDLLFDSYAGHAYLNI